MAEGARKEIEGPEMQVLRSPGKNLGLSSSFPSSSCSYKIYLKGRER